MARAFADVLRDLNGGETYEQLTCDLVNAVQAVMMHGKSASITLSLTIAGNGPGSVTISEKITTKLPEPPKGKSIFFATESGNLSRNDPRQVGSMELRAVDGPSRETPRDITESATTGNLRDVG